MAVVLYNTNLLAVELAPYQYIAIQLLLACALAHTDIVLVDAPVGRFVIAQYNDLPTVLTQSTPQ